MAISEKDAKILWGRAAGRCSSPDCKRELTDLVLDGAYSIGEMAHIIGRNPTAARTSQGVGEDAYENLILLCPTCHREIDKAPEGEFTVDVLHVWKEAHEKWVSTRLDSPSLATYQEFLSSIGDHLRINRRLFETFGPQSETALSQPESNLHSVWEVKRLSEIMPRNRAIKRLIETYWALIPEKDRDSWGALIVHIDAYEHHLFSPLDCYPTFPKAINKIVII